MRDIFECTNKIYEHLGDNLSKKIYLDCISYNLTNDEQIMNKSLRVNVLSKAPFFLDDIMEKHKDKEKIIFGAGNYGKLLKTLTPEYDWACYVDNNYNNLQVQSDIPVISFHDFLEKYRNPFLVLASHRYANEMLDQALNGGIDREYIWDFGRCLKKLQEGQYFDFEYLTHEENEVFVDVGVYDGKTTKKFIKWADNKYDHVYLFEPNRDLYEISRKTISHERNCTIYNLGLWNKTEDLCFYENPKDREFVSDLEGYEFFDSSVDHIAEWKKHKVSAVALDEVLADTHVTFIKMDIEGAEGKALEGAKQLITRYKPKLAISSYHRKEDLWELPHIILSCRNDYKFYLRYYYVSCRCGAVLLYAV